MRIQRASNRVPYAAAPQGDKPKGAGVRLEALLYGDNTMSILLKESEASPKNKLHYWKKKYRKKLKRAERLLHIEKDGDCIYRVWGGESEHLIVVDHGGNPICDCDPYTKLHVLCSHILKYNLTFGDTSK